MHETQVPGHLGIADHASAHDADLAAHLLGRLDDLLDPVNIAGETGHDDPALGLGENTVEFLAHHLFGKGIAIPFDVGGIGKQQQHALGPVIGELVQVDGHAVDGGGVDLEIAGMDHDAPGGRDGQAAAIHDAVGDPDELDLENRPG